MIFRIRIGRWRFTFTMAPVTNVVGVNSLLPNGNHILMWDFDEKDIRDIISWLRVIQQQWQLPNIYILTSGQKHHYIAYCFYQCSWRLAVRIISSTPLIDWYFFKYGVYREHFTLRVTPKEGRKIRLLTVLKSLVPENTYIKELRSWTKYETLSDQANTRKVEINIGR